jgi:hypothetical protein
MAARVKIRHEWHESTPILSLLFAKIRGIRAKSSSTLCGETTWEPFRGKTLAETQLTC